MKTKIRDFGERFHKSTRNLIPAIQLVWEADRFSFLTLFGITLLTSVLPIAQAMVARWIVDSVLAASNQNMTIHEGFRTVGPYLAGEILLILTGQVLGQARKFAAEILNQKLSQFVSTKIMQSASRLDIQYFEDSAFLDKLQSARQETKFRAMALVNAGFFLIQNLLTLLSFATSIIWFNPWMALILFGSTFPSFVAQSRYSKLNFRLHTWRAPEGRKMAYLEHLLTHDSAAKEIRIFQLAKSFLSKHSELFERIFAEDKKFAVRKSLASLFWGAVSTLSFYGCYGWIIMRTIVHAITLGQMTFYLSAFRQLQGTFSGLFDNINSIFENGLFMQHLFAVLDAPERAEIEKAPAGFSIDLTKGIEFRNVSFRYPNQLGWALKNFSLKVLPGQTIALVGENGSGKTTLIKLLTRLYLPTSGDIILFGQNLANYRDVDLYRLFSAIFQDFVHYQSTARDNISYGAVDLAETAADSEFRFLEAARRGGSLDVVEKLSEGWDTMLGGWFKGGQQLSGGQWQRIALSRAFIREAEILILDEPTSALDAENELNVFDRLKKASAGKISFLVSHRFSTVRIADQIIVLNHGEILEAGGHEELMNLGGQYARLFEMQAKGYR